MSTQVEVVLLDEVPDEVQAVVDVAEVDGERHVDVGHVGRHLSNFIEKDKVVLLLNKFLKVCCCQDAVISRDDTVQS